VLPETFIPLYPSNSWARQAASFGGFDELWERLWENSVDVPGPLVDRLSEACREHSIHCAIGVNERESERPGSIYNTLLLIGPQGLIWKHRKLMPTHHEKLFHGFGKGDDLQVIETPHGRIGGLICWENRMPLARYAVYRGGPQIWLAPNADATDGWLASMRHIAIESGAFVVSVAQFIPASAFPSDFPMPPPDRNRSRRGRDYDHDDLALPGRDLHRRGGSPPSPPLHQPRPAGFRAREPPRDGKGRAVRPLLALPGDAPPSLSR